MRLLLKIVGVLLLLVLVIAGAGFLYFINRFPDVPPAQAVTLPTSPDVVARGAYLAQHVAVCVDCHSERDWTRFAGPLKPGTFGQGGERFDTPNSGVPGTLYASNITPAGIGDYSDGELLRAVTTGVARDGRAMFPLMPYPNYGQLASDDVQAMLAYVRTLSRIDHQVPARSLDFPMSLIVNIIPKAAAPGVRPSPADRAAYGKYLVTAASCGECHTKIDDRGQKLPGMDFAGGSQFAHPELGYRVRSANITPDADSGIGQWTEEQFVNKFKGFEAPDDHVLTDAEQRQNTAMPWRQYAGMTREDLGAIYTYLRTLKPVLNRVDKFPDARPAGQ
jgi:mono/diheme cytochrome c family protein